MIQKSHGFTIVELLIVIVVIAILAALSYVGYTSISNRAAISVLQSDLSQAAKQLDLAKVESGTYQGTDGATTDGSPLQKSDGTTFQYTRSNSGQSFCITATTTKANIPAYTISSDNKTPREGTCPGHTGPSTGGGSETIADGALMQTITSTNCPTTRTRAVDARDNRTYWVQKMDDGKCWMLTNLAYAGGGTNTYSDTIPTTILTNGTSDASTIYTAAKYYVPTGANPTTEPTNPSTSTNGTGQYGYLYNWCAAMGAQTTTSACANATTPAPSTTISICPANWRLPIGNGGEFTLLNNAVNSGLTNTDAGLRSEWLAQRSGYWYNGFGSQGSYGYYWSSTQSSATSAHYLSFSSTSVYPAGTSNKLGGFAVRCVAV